MPLLINEEDLSSYQEAVTLGKALVVSPELFESVQQIRQLTGQPGGEEVFIRLLLELLARQIQVTQPDDDTASVSIDQELIDRLVIYTYVGHVAVTTAEEVAAQAAKVKQLDQAETGEQTGSPTKDKEK